MHWTFVAKHCKLVNDFGKYKTVCVYVYTWVLFFPSAAVLVSSFCFFFFFFSTVCVIFSMNVCPLLSIYCVYVCPLLFICYAYISFFPFDAVCMLFSLFFLLFESSSFLCMCPHLLYICVSYFQWLCVLFFSLVWFDGISTIVGYLMPNPLIYIKLFVNIFCW